MGGSIIGKAVNLRRAKEGFFQKVTLQLGLEGRHRATCKRRNFEYLISKMTLSSQYHALFLFLFGSCVYFRAVEECANPEYQQSPPVFTHFSLACRVLLNLHNLNYANWMANAMRTETMS